MTSKGGHHEDPAINWSSQQVAERRNRGRARRGQIQAPATQMMLELAEVRTGSRILDGSGKAVIGVVGDKTLLGGIRSKLSAYDVFIQEPLDTRDGQLYVPNKPGLGMDMNVEYLKAHAVAGFGG